MKMLKRLFWLTLRRPKIRKRPGFPAPIVDPEEFARLIGSGRVEDLRILAQRLSGRPKERV